ncbi:hypothetical protein [Amylibacter sp. IMCC11727]|uniref:hypothetical protein n=1 Tax=Amylibacter sp. IMCC11727 TaxID=3039851 RepID=UPI00244E3B95|nr:hypothetical protein [Amylibacter sp. IMCC11727]WGI21925.1 hypothetical protein QBD29_00445 [Amylibacter sp. IMCC11727]
MKQILLICVLALCVVRPDPLVAQSHCYVDYKAKKSDGGALQLHYGVIKLGQNACSNATRRTKAVSKRISAGGWTLLRVMSTFDESGLQQRRGNAGRYFLRY